MPHRSGFALSGGARKLLDTFEGLLQNRRPVFSQERTFERARLLTFGLPNLRMHLTSTAICASGGQFQDWSADYRVCSPSPWEPRQLFDVVLDHLPELLPSPEAPVWAALDGTILKKAGRCLRAGIDSMDQALAARGRSGDYRGRLPAGSE